MSSEIITVQFSEGVSVAAPAQLARIANKLSNFANDAAFVTANGTATDGNIYWNTTENAIRVYNGTAWEYVYGTDKIAVSCLDNQTNTDITGLLFDNAVLQAVEMSVAVFRRNNSQDRSQYFTIKLLKDTETGNWRAPIVDGNFDDAEITFDITVAGQLRYSTTSFAGTGYSGNIRVSNIKTLRVVI